MGCCGSARVGSSKPDHLPEEFEGPVQKRRCTDVFWLIVFVLFFGYLVVSVVVAGVQGNPRRLMFGVDEYGNLCGVKNVKITGADRSGMDYSAVKYLKVSQTCSNEDCRQTKDCVKSCPEGYEKTTLRRCLPTAVTQTTGKLLQSTLPFLEEVGSDLNECWKEIVLLCLISVGLSVLVLLVFRFCASVIIWTVLIVVTLASIALTVYLWVLWHRAKKELESYEGPNQDLKAKRVRNWMIAAIVSTIFTVIYLIVVIYMRKKIKLVAALFEEAGRCVSAMPLILLQPVQTFVSLSLSCLFVLAGVVCLQTSGRPLVEQDGRVSFPTDTFFQVTTWVSLFGFLWLSQFVLACQDFVVAGAVASWFFTRDKHKLGSPICRSLRFLTGFHLGSVAFGSLTIAIVKAVRALFRMLKKHMDQQNQQCDTFWKFFQCCLACFENYLKFLSKNAYIMIVIYGEGFCASAKRSFATLTMNMLRIAAVDCIADLVLFVAKMGVTATVALIALEILKVKEGLHYVWVPVALSCIFAFLCCHCFLSVYEMAIDTLLLCFCTDCEMNDGVSKPYFMNRSLMVLVENSRKSAVIAKKNV